MTGRLAEAVSALRYRQITALLDKGVNINGRLDDGRTPLMIALDIPDADKRRHMFRFLAHHGAEILESDSDDVSVFQQCCRRAYLDLMEIVLHKAGVSAVNIMGRDKMGRTAIYHAVMSEDAEVVHTVLDNINLRHHSVDLPDYEGLTPLLYARKHGLTEIAEALLERANANPRICDAQHHMNAMEWEAEAERQKRDRDAHDKKHARERYMIFPPIDHATRRKERLAKTKSKTTTSLPNLTKQPVKRNRDRRSSPPTPKDSLPIPSLNPRLPNIHSPSGSTSSSNTFTRQGIDPRTKSIDSAITLLGLASQNADEKSYAMSFISSRSGSKQMASGSVAHKGAQGSDRHLRRTWDNMMDAYSVQTTSNFRKPAKPPELPQIPQEQDKPGKKSKMSTLAIILRAGRGGKSARGKHGKGAESLGTGDHPGKLSRRRTTALTGIHGDGKSKMALPDLIEDESEMHASKHGKKDKSGQKRDALPNIIVS